MTARKFSGNGDEAAGLQSFVVLTTFLCLRVVLAGWADAGDFCGQGWRGPMLHRGLSKKTQPVFVHNLSLARFSLLGPRHLAGAPGSRSRLAHRSIPSKRHPQFRLVSDYNRLLFA